ncbi:MAG: M20/M25/M40 family metallo-hydrolase [Chloroflexota bacterium]|nr:M20/M25/M40 family metallo-hydrolase [Chloroflexota bacterium]
MNDKELVSFTKRLLELQSFDREKSKVPQFIFDTLEEYGAEPKVLERAGIKNIVALTSQEKGVVFNGHWDTVLPTEEYNREILPVTTVGGYIQGLGASDMKSGVAAQCAAFIECLKREIPGVVLSVVGDEELGGENGTSLLIENGYFAPYVILGEPTNLKLSLGQKGGMHVKVTSRGKLAHGAYPHRGENAILNMYNFFHKLLDLYPLPAGDADNGEVFLMTTASIGTIEGGASSNVVPDRCEATIDIRVPPHVTFDEVEQALHKIAGEAGAEVESGFLGHGWQLDKASRIYEVSKEAVEVVTGKEVAFVQKLGTNDGKYYAYRGAQITNIGPGDNRFSHTMREQVSITYLTMARDIYVRMAQLLSS